MSQLCIPPSNSTSLQQFGYHTVRNSEHTGGYQIVCKIHNSQVPIQSIKHHGCWALDCVWTYIQQDETFSANIASSFAVLLHNVPT